MGALPPNPRDLALWAIPGVVLGASSLGRPTPVYGPSAALGLRPRIALPSAWALERLAETGGLRAAKHEVKSASARLT